MMLTYYNKIWVRRLGRKQPFATQLVKCVPCGFIIIIIYMILSKKLLSNEGEKLDFSYDILHESLYQIIRPNWVFDTYGVQHVWLLIIVFD